MKRIAIHTAPPFHPRTCMFRKKAYSPGKGEEMGNIFCCLFQSTRKLRKPGLTMKCELSYTNKSHFSFAHSPTQRKKNPEESALDSLSLQRNAKNV